MGLLLFFLFIKELTVYIRDSFENGIYVSQEMSNSIALLFADDVIVPDTITGLQNRLNALQDYCNKWGMDVNIDKTK